MEFAESPLLHNHVYGRQEQKEAKKKPINKNIYVFVIFSYSELCNIASGLGLVESKTTMVGERTRREPWGEAERWKEKRKVWRKLQKGGMTRFMEKLHGFDAGVTKAMVDSWHNGKVKIDSVSHQITEGLIADVTGFSQDGMNFYRDKKMFANTINDFVKDDKEKRKLVKIDTYYDIESIKKI